MKYFLSIALIFCTINLTYAQKVNVKKQIAFAESQAKIMLGEIHTLAAPDKLVAPRTIENSKLKLVPSGDWTSGFFAGQLWYLYEYTGDKNWAEAARRFTKKLEKEQFNTGTHDLGFMIYCSYGNAYRLTDSPAYKEVIIQASRSLSQRFNPGIGLIRSWDHNKSEWRYPVIIDNMMNLEMLFEATRLSGDSSFYKLAVTHADNTLKNHFRPDFSSYHVVDYNEDGSVRKKVTHQGYSDESAWARGQAWALYGYTMCYRETKNKRYLKQAEGIADFILRNLPADKVPFWDYNDPQIPRVSKDASAAAITASALLELRRYSQFRKSYAKAAKEILQSLSKKYTSRPGTNFGFILDHSTGHRPANSEINVPLNYADYYYLEALLRYDK